MDATVRNRKHGCQTEKEGMPAGKGQDACWERTGCLLGKDRMSAGKRRDFLQGKDRMSAGKGRTIGKKKTMFRGMKLGKMKAKRRFISRNRRGKQHQNNVYYPS